MTLSPAPAASAPLPTSPAPNGDHQPLPSAPAPGGPSAAGNGPVGTGHTGRGGKDDTAGDIEHVADPSGGVRAAPRNDTVTASANPGRTAAPKRGPPEQELAPALSHPRANDAGSAFRLPEPDQSGSVSPWSKGFNDWARSALPHVPDGAEEFVAANTTGPVLSAVRPVLNADLAILRSGQQLGRRFANGAIDFVYDNVAGTGRQMVQPESVAATNTHNRWDPVLDGNLDNLARDYTTNPGEAFSDDLRTVFRPTTPFGTAATGLIGTGAGNTAAGTIATGAHVGARWGPLLAPTAALNPVTAPIGILTMAVNGGRDPAGQLIHDYTTDAPGAILEDLSAATIVFGGVKGLGARSTARSIAEPKLTEAAALAARTRTAEGLVDEAALAQFVDALPRLDVDSPGGVPSELHRLTNDALGRDDLALRPVEAGKGFSGAPVYLVRDVSGDMVAVVKQFPKVRELAQELSALERLGRDEFARFGTPRVHAVARADLSDGTAGVLVMSRAPGRSLHDVINDVRESAERPAAWAQAKTAVADAGKALAELHSRSASPGRVASEAFIDGNYRGARTAASRLVAEHGQLLREAGIDPGSLRARVDELYEAMRADPGPASVVHGDAHAGNIFWAPGESRAAPGQVTFIDNSVAHFSMDRSGAAIGTSARDISKLVRWLERYEMRGFLREEAIGLRDTFLEAYRAGGAPVIPDATSMAFTTRYALGSVEAELRSLARPDISPATRKTLAKQLSYELVTLRQALERRR